MPGFDFGADVFDGGGAGVGAGGEGSVEGEDFRCGGVVGRVDFSQVELIERGGGADGFCDGFSDKFVGVAEGDAFFDEPVREVGGEEHGVGSGGAAVGFAEFHGGDHLGVDGEDEVELVDGIEERGFVFLEVAVVGEGKAFDGEEEVDEVAGEASRFSSGELADVGVFLLRHQG